jgi:cytoskeletal protein RodZ
VHYFPENKCINSAVCLQYEEPKSRGYDQPSDDRYYSDKSTDKSNSSSKERAQSYQKRREEYRDRKASKTNQAPKTDKVKSDLDTNKDSSVKIEPDAGNTQNNSAMEKSGETESRVDDFQEARGGDADSRVQMDEAGDSEGKDDSGRDSKGRKMRYRVRLIFFKKRSFFPYM